MRRGVIMFITNFFMAIRDVIWASPLVIFVALAGLAVTVLLRGVQFRYFLDSWRFVLFPKSKGKSNAAADITPLQAFLNSLSVSIGNSSLAGMATVLFGAGPGAIFWVMVFGFLCMALRFAEVYLGTKYVAEGKQLLGGPIAYLKKVPGGKFLPVVYAIFCFGYCLTLGNAIQCNSMRLGLCSALKLSPLPIAIAIFLFVAYVMLGGAKRIIKVSDALVPVKVIVFFFASSALLIYHFKAIIPAFWLMFEHAFTPGAIAGGGAAISMQMAMRFGLSRSMGATESGLGTASLFFGATGDKEPAKVGIMSMLSTFISAQLVCVVVGLCIIASGVWNNGLTSTDLTISAFQTLFGWFAPWLITFLSVTFGLGVIIGIAYIARLSWLFLTGGRYVGLFNAIYCLAALFGALSSVTLVWTLGDIFNGGMLWINVFGIICLLPVIMSGLRKFEAGRKKD